MKAITNQEAISIRNEIESLRVNARKEDLQHLPSRAKEWILNENIQFNSLDHYAKREAINALYKTDSNDDIYAFAYILKATKIAKYVEIANKLLQIHHNQQNDEKIEIAIAVMSNQVYDVNTEYQKSRKTLTLTKEIKQIKKRNKKENRKKSKLIRKYKNISNLYRDYYTIYNSILRFIANKNPYLASHLQKHNTHPSEYMIQEFVYEHQEAIVDMLNEEPELQFAKSQKIGKIR